MRVVNDAQSARLRIRGSTELLQIGQDGDSLLGVAPFGFLHEEQSGFQIAYLFPTSRLEKWNCESGYIARERATKERENCVRIAPHPRGKYSLCLVSPFFSL